MPMNETSDTCTTNEKDYTGIQFTYSLRLFKLLLNNSTGVTNCKSQCHVQKSNKHCRDKTGEKTFCVNCTIRVGKTCHTSVSMKILQCAFQWKINKWTSFTTETPIQDMRNRPVPLTSIPVLRCFDCLTLMYNMGIVCFALL